MPLPLEEGLAAVPQTLSAFYRFSRPHTMLGTFISVLSVSALALVSQSSPCTHASMHDRAILHGEMLHCCSHLGYLLWAERPLIG